MSASRMGFNLLSKAGLENFRFCRKHKDYRIDWKYVWEDTIGPVVCRMLGHRPYNSGTQNHIEWACLRCHQYIKESSHAE